MDEVVKKILIVEDDIDYLILLQKKFEMEGFSVVTAKDGKEGLVVAEREKPDLIILDILMPKLDGISMAERLREKNLGIPIIFLTNVGDASHISKAMQANSSADYIVKSDLSIDDVIRRAREKLSLKY